jgi:hypothetical protein
MDITASAKKNLKGDHPRSSWTKFGFIPSISSEEDCQFSNKSEAIAAILDLGQGH